MAEARKPTVYSIPAHRAFADALAAGLIRRFGGEPLGLARGLVLVPNNRSKRAVTEAFVRASGGGLLLPRLVAIGDADLDESVGALFDPADSDDPVAPAIEPIARRMMLARLVQTADPAIDGAEAVRLAGDLARTLDALLIEEVTPSRLRTVVQGGDALSRHWERALESFKVVLERWPAELARVGRIDLAARRGLLFDRIGAAWATSPPEGFVCVAGVTSTAPAIARLLRSISELPRGMVVLPALDLAMDEEAWGALGPFPPDPVTGRRKRAEETHPQYALKLLLDRMSVARGEVRQWQAASEIDAPPARSRAIATALSPASLTHRWVDLKTGERNLGGVAALEVATPAEEAQAIALALREVAETPGQTAALVTPDRALARRVAAHCARWNIHLDDSAGQPLSQTPPGTLLLAIAEAGAQDFAPVALLTLLKHPLVASGDGRQAWLEGARLLDRRLRGPRPAAGLAGLDAHLAPTPAAEWWVGVRPLLQPIEDVFARGAQPLEGLLACVREAATALAGDNVWSRAEGRAAAELLAELELRAGLGPELIEPAALPALLRVMMDEVAVRPPQGGHPRLSIYGLLEARLQSADLMILAGLNEGVWPGKPAPDPWLAPRIRAELGLPGLEARIGVSAHDFASGLGAPRVLLTRARRDATSPTIASRFWLRLQALAGEGWARADDLLGWARALDDPGDYQPAVRPEPSPPADQRPRQISVTEVDRLKADPYAFYARKMLRLLPLDPVDADATAAWRGTEVHRVLKEWFEQDDCEPAQLRPRAEALLAESHPMMRALWAPRLYEAVDWIAAKVSEMGDEQRRVLRVEQKGRITIAGVELSGTFDRLDRMGDGTLGIVDYKTGKAPSVAAVREGFSLQLGLLGLIAERQGFEGISGTAGGFEYWSLAKDGGSFGKVSSPVDPVGARNKIRTDEFVGIAADQFTNAAKTWLTGEAPFTAKLKPEFAPYTEYDQLMRRDEWYGRE